MKKYALKECVGVLSSFKYEAGDHFSMDQFVVDIPGPFYQGYGQELTGNSYSGDTIYVDFVRRTRTNYSQFRCKASERLDSAGHSDRHVNGMSYLIHMGLRWTEQGTHILALWLFVVCHAMRVSNYFHIQHVHP